MAKTYPDDTFENAARKAGARVQCLWQRRGPKDTLIAWQECLMVDTGVAIVQTYAGGGWDVFTPLNQNNVDASIADALVRCGVIP